jgi:hypothetical protein
MTAGRPVFAGQSAEAALPPQRFQFPSVRVHWPDAWHAWFDSIQPHPQLQRWSRFRARVSQKVLPFLLFIGIPALLILAVAGSMDQGGSAPPREPGQVAIPGLVADEVKQPLARTFKFQFTGPQKVESLWVDIGEVTGVRTGIHFRCRIYQRADWELLRVEYVLDSSDARVPPARVEEATENFFNKVAQAAYFSADSKATTTWIMGQLPKIEETREAKTAVGPVLLTLQGKPSVRSLSITPLEIVPE